LGFAPLKEPQTCAQYFARVLIAARANERFNEIRLLLREHYIARRHGRGLTFGGHQVYLCWQIMPMTNRLVSLDNRRGSGRRQRAIPRDPQRFGAAPQPGTSIARDMIARNT
jgi:hypothetical protein